jgi:hypothetical protein
MLSSIRNFFAIIGVLLIAALIYALIKFGPVYQVLNNFDGNALPVYTEMANKLLATGNLAETMVWKVPVADGVTVDQVEATMKSVASEHNIKEIGELPLSSEVQTITGHEQRYIKVFMFCNAMTASRMIAYNDAYSAYFPCRISLVADKAGKLWLYAFNMNTIIFGGKPLPPDLREEAIGVKAIMQDIMNRGAKGEVVMPEANSAGGEVVKPDANGAKSEVVTPEENIVPKPEQKQ